MDGGKLKEAGMARIVYHFRDCALAGESRGFTDSASDC